MTLRSPVRGQIYTVREIVTELKLRDTPFLKACIKNPVGDEVEVVIQLGWLPSLDILIPLMGDNKYRFRRETDEWIPVFDFVGSEEEFLQTVNTNIDLDPYHDVGQPVGMVVWPKGTEYEQYYKLVFCPTQVTDHDGDRYDITEPLRSVLVKAGRIKD
ncbi:hypothetical protein [Flavobacterium sp.]|jgi:hypothetical protein|uniref:hypothetical protein n=1 Tax=Flavobacterium sp. TaxID=239 RepID=UPI0037BFD0AE